MRADRAADEVGDGVRVRRIAIRRGGALWLRYEARALLEGSRQRSALTRG
jgi:hypothetical protein